MARTYRDIAIEGMLRTVEEAMSGVIDWWGDLPAPMKDAIEQFRTQLGAAIDSVEFVKRALDRQVPETDTGTGRPDLFDGRRMGNLCGPGRLTVPAAPKFMRPLVGLPSLPAREGRQVSPDLRSRDGSGTGHAAGPCRS